MRPLHGAVATWVSMLVRTNSARADDFKCRLLAMMKAEVVGRCPNERTSCTRVLVSRKGDLGTVRLMRGFLGRPACKRTCSATQTRCRG